MICFQPCGKKLPQMDHAENTRWCLFFSFHYSLANARTNTHGETNLLHKQTWKVIVLCVHTFCSCNGKEVFLRLEQSKPISYDFKKNFRPVKKWKGKSLLGCSVGFSLGKAEQHKAKSPFRSDLFLSLKKLLSILFKSRSKSSFKILTNVQHRNLDQTSAWKSWSNFNRHWSLPTLPYIYIYMLIFFPVNMPTPLLSYAFLP